MSARAEPTRPVRAWPLLLLAAPAGVAIWTGWVGLGELTGFGTVHPLPGIWDDLQLDTAITMPIGVEAYAGYALRAWLTPGTPARARRFAKRSAIGALVLGALGQIAYHLMAAAHVTTAPWPITTLVACLPVAVLGMGVALAHLLRDPRALVTETPAASQGRTLGAPDAPSAGPAETDQVEQNRTGSPALPAVRPDPGAGPDISDLLPAGRRIADRLARQGRPLSRSVLLAELRADGRRCSTERAGALLALLRTGRTGPDPARRPARRAA